MVPIAIALGEQPRVGRTYTLSSFDPIAMAPAPLFVRVEAESSFVFADSARFDDAQRRWLTAHRDSVRAWRIATDGPAAVRAWIDERLAAGEGGVVACSALRRAHREVIVRGLGERVRLVSLEADRALLASRLAGRSGHFLPPSLLDSQLATLEPPADDERPIRIPAEWPVTRAVAAVLRALGIVAANG
jgi:gluconate kinase